MSYLVHHGIRGQKWGVKNGPPYPLKGRDYSETEKKYMGKRSSAKNSLRNKQHFDTTLDAGTTIATLSRSEDRLHGADMFYATYDKQDRDQYMSMFNTPVTDATNKKVYKFLIETKNAKDMKVASEDSSVESFKKLIKTNRDFANFVFDENRMQSHFVKSKYKFSAYREARRALERGRKSGYELTDKDLRSIYKMFNYIIPSDAGGNQREAKDVLNQRTKFFKELKKEGYGALLDANDAIYGGMKARSPIIVFDMENVIDERVRRTKYSDTLVSGLRFAGRRMLGG